MHKLRVFFKKQGRAKYISHLDMNRCLTRAIKRAGLPVWYTEGFNPHMYLTFPLPLSLGYESICECVDLRLTELLPMEEIQERLNQSLPQDIRVYRCAEPKMDQKEIALGEYEIELFCQAGVNPVSFAEALLSFYQQESILVSKKTKKGMKEVDIKPLVEVLSCKAAEESIQLRLRCATGIETNINPSLFLEAIPAYAESVGLAHVKRVNVTDKAGNTFE